MPVVYDGRVYVATGQNVEHGEGDGHLWCLDPAKRLDGANVSDELVAGEPNGLLPKERIKSNVPKDRIRPEPEFGRRVALFGERSEVA
jgi:hypothetical protein